LATGLAARFDAASDLGFQKRVAEAVAESAVNIYSELATVAGHAARASYASAVLGDPPLSLIWSAAPIVPARRAYAFALALVGQGIDNTSTDAAISNGVASVWNALAGA